MIRPKPGAMCKRVQAWLAQAQRGEVLQYYKGNRRRLLMAPEQRMTKEERAAHTSRIAHWRANGGEKPKIKDDFKAERPDMMALVEILDAAENRGLIKQREIVVARGAYVYEIEMMVQRNGLKSVRARQGVRTGAG